MSKYSLQHFDNIRKYQKFDNKTRKECKRYLKIKKEQEKSCVDMK